MLVVWLRGGRWERLAAGAFFAASAITPFVQDRQNAFGPQYGYLVVDTALFVALTAIALRSRLWWATWAAGFQLLGLFIHLAIVVDDQVRAYAYYRGIVIYSYLVMVAIGAGALLRPARRR